jgi:hypothetical protein
LYSATNHFRRRRFTSRQVHVGFKHNGAFYLRLTNPSGKREDEQASNDTCEHPAHKQAASHT